MYRIHSDMDFWCIALLPPRAVVSPMGKFWGVGRSRLSVIGMQSLTQVNRSEPAPFLYPYKTGSVHCGSTGAVSKEFNQGVEYDDDQE
jgi:hypothetical protein